MATTTLTRFGTLALGLSLLAFGVFFANVLIGGPLGMKPWMSDLYEMLTLFIAVGLFVAGTLAKEAVAKARGGPDPGPS